MLKRVSEKRLYRESVLQSIRINAEESGIRTTEVRARNKKLFGLAVVAFFASWALVSALMPKPTTPKSVQDWQYISVGKSAVMKLLKDRGSAEFRHERWSGTAVCGEVNARNSFGGMTGFQRFVATSGFAVLEENMQAQDFAEVWAKAC